MQRLESMMLMSIAPVASDSDWTGTHDQPVTGAAFGEIMDADVPGPLTYSASGVSHGVLDFNSADGSFTYTPNPRFVGQDEFTFSVNDGANSSNVATVTINIVNGAPTTSNASASTIHDQPYGFAVSGSDVNGEQITFSLVSDVSHGTLTLYSSGLYSYVPSTRFVGADSFTFKANDGITDSNVSRVTINVTNAAPFAEDPTPISLPHDTQYQGSAMADDSDGDQLTYSVVGGATHGSISMDSNGSFTYTPSPGYSGTDSFTFKANDGIADSDPATVAFIVSPYPKTISSTASASWDYQVANPLDDWLAGKNSISLSISGVTDDGVTFEGPPSVDTESTARFGNSQEIVKDGTATAFTRTVNGVLIQGYTVTYDIKWSYSKVFLINAFGAAPDWLDSLFGNNLNVYMETSITLSIMANGTVSDPVITNSDNASAFSPSSP